MKRTINKVRRHKEKQVRVRERQGILIGIARGWRNGHVAGRQKCDM
jgi:hypothetical protein